MCLEQQMYCTSFTTLKVIPPVVSSRDCVLHLDLVSAIGGGGGINMDLPVSLSATPWFRHDISKTFWGLSNETSQNNPVAKGWILHVIAVRSQVKVTRSYIVRNDFQMVSYHCLNSTDKILTKSSHDSKMTSTGYFYMSKDEKSHLVRNVLQMKSPIYFKFQQWDFTGVVSISKWRPVVV